MDTPSVFKSIRGLGLLHMNVMSKMDLLDFWVHDTYPDILFLTKTWLSGLIMNTDIGIGDYNIFRCDILKKRLRGGYTCEINACSLSVTIHKKCECLVIDVALCQNTNLFVAGIYCRPAALADAVGTISEYL